MARLDGLTVIADTAETINMADPSLSGTISALGSAGNDLLRGNNYDNYLVGNGGDDYLWGGLGGNDYMIGGTGNNAYWWGYDNGSDMIRSSSGGDVLVEYNAPAGAHFSWYERSDLIIQIDTGSSRYASLRLQNWLTTPTTQRLQSVIHSDNVAYLWNASADAAVDLSNSTYTTLGVTQASAIYAQGNCTLRGSSADNILIGGSYNDQLTGGAGNDILLGGGGSDTVWWGGEKDGHDTILDDTSNALDKIRLLGLKKKDLTAQLIGDDYILSPTKGGGSLTIQNWSISSSKLQTLQFDDGLITTTNFLASMATIKK